MTWVTTSCRTGYRWFAEPVPYSVEISYRLLDKPPNQDILNLVKDVRSDASDLGTILASPGVAASNLGKKRIEEEFADLFVGAPMPRLMPYASHYSSGQLFGRALAELRMDLGKLGIARREDTTEPEDHSATLFEIMSALLVTSFHQTTTRSSISCGVVAGTLRPKTGARFSPRRPHFFVCVLSSDGRKNGIHFSSPLMGDILRKSGEFSHKG
jgi:hypothetical protein